MGQIDQGLARDFWSEKMSQNGGSTNSGRLISAITGSDRKKASTAAAALIAVSAMAGLTPRANAAVYASVSAANAATGAVTVNNVTISNVLSVSSTSSFYTLAVQDASAGVQLYKFPFADFTSFTPVVGDVVDVTATNSPFGGNPEFSSTAASVSLVSTGTFVPAPITTTVANSAFTTESTAGLLAETVQLDGVTITPSATATGAAATSFVSSGTYFATDALGTTQLFIYNSDTTTAALEGQAIPTGPVNLTAYVDYYSAGSLIELYPTAIVAVPEPAAATLGLVAAAGALLVARRRTRLA